MTSATKRLLASVAWLAAFGCGGGNSANPSLCNDLDSALTSTASKAAPCTSTPPATGFSVDTCRATISNCSDSDQQRIRDLTTCLQGLPACSASTQAAWQTSFQTCASKVGPLAGQGC
jgi:hypothetical protein